MAKQIATLTIPKMHCASCAIPIEKVLHALPGIQNIQTDYEQGSVEVIFDDQKVTLKEIKNKIASIGYASSLISENDNVRNEQSAFTWDMSIYRLLASILASVLLMVISMVPAFSSQAWSSWLMFIVATPVQFWAAWDFYVSAWMALKNRTVNMYTLIVLGTSIAYFYSVFVLFGESWLASYKIPLHTYFETSTSIISLVLLGNFLETYARGKTSYAIKKLLGLQAKTATVLRNGKEQEVAIDNVQVGDTLLIRPGEKVPVDGTIIKGESTLDESMVTGESTPIHKSEGDNVIGATLSQSGSFEMEATRVGADTVLAKIVELVQRAQSSKAPIQGIVDKVSEFFIPSVIVASLLTFFAWFMWGPEPVALYAMINMVAVLIIACPCAMGLAVPMSLIVGIGRAAEMGILVKDAGTLEIAGNVNVLIFDKTGTITKGKQEVVSFHSISTLDTIAKEQRWAIPENKNADDYLASLIVSVERLSTHPVSQAIVRYFGQEVIVLNAEKIETISGFGIRAEVDGLFVLIGSEKLMEREGISIPQELARCIQEEASGTHSFVAVNNVCVAECCLKDTIRSGAQSVISYLKDQDIISIMITGDNKVAAQSVAEHVGIKKFFSEVLPEDKEKYVQQVKETHPYVGMVGDGINDAPALARADVGIAMSGGTDVAIETAGIVLLHSDISLIPRVIKVSRLTKRNIIQNLIWAFGYNVVLIPVAMGVLYPWWGITLNPIFAGAAMAFSSLSVVLNALRLRRMNID